MRGFAWIVVTSALASAVTLVSLATRPTALAAPSSPAAPAKAVDAQDVVDRLAAKVGKLGGRVGAVVLAVRDQKQLGEHEGDRPMNPASNAKLGTAAAALWVLGPQHRFTTGLFGKVEDGRVDELVLRGRGDPGLSTADLRDLVRGLRGQGVSKVGAITVDQSAFAEWVPPAFEQQPNEWAAFRAPVAPISVDRNTVTLLVRPGATVKAPASVVVDPQGFIDIEGAIRTGARDVPEKISVDLSVKGDHLVAKIGGVVPQGHEPVSITRRVDDPRALAGYALRAVLREQGVAVGDALRVGAAAEKHVLASKASAPVGELIGHLGKDSDNFTAEMLFLAVAEKKSGATFGEGARAIEGALRAVGAFGEGTIIRNGSGLFDANRISAKSLATLLVAAAGDPRIAPEFVAQLSIAGVDGTLRNRLTRWRDGRLVRAKTGTLSQAVTLSGYVMGADGQPLLAFSFLVEGVKGKTQAAREALDHAVDELVERSQK